VILVGFMGTGKSAVGRCLAHWLDCPFVDLDARISETAGISIPGIFAGEGEAGFREREHQALLDALQQPFHILSCGGGVVLREDNRNLLLQQPRAYCLHAEPAVIWERVKGDRNRPLLQSDNPRARLLRLFEERAPLYAQFPRKISTGHFRISEVAGMILSDLRKDGISPRSPVSGAESDSGSPPPNRR